MDINLALANDQQFTKRIIETTIRIALLAALASWCFLIVNPFLIPVIWGIIIAVAIYPAYHWLALKLNDSNKLAATIFSLGLLTLIIVPSILLTGTLVESVQTLAKLMLSGKVVIPAPPDYIASWPIVGESLDNFWRLASINLDTALKQIAPYLKGAAGWLLSIATGTGLTILKFIISIIIAGVLLVNSEAGGQLARKFSCRLSGKRGLEFVTLAENTIRSVVRGILGVALIQSLLAGLGFLFAGVPGAGLWALLCLLLAVIQIGIAPITLPVIIYLFSNADTFTAVAFLIWIIPVSLLDNFLKPILLSRGVKTPMAVIFVGAIGGFMASGLIGLFTGAVIFSLSYDLFIMWLYEDSQSDQQSEQVKD